MRFLNFLNFARISSRNLETREVTPEEIAVLGTTEEFLENQRKYSEENDVRLTVFYGGKTVVFEAGHDITDEVIGLNIDLDNLE